jgi:HAD superfamily 5'-nucleotidase-like hydrolase
VSADGGSAMIDLDPYLAPIPRERGIFCNRTLNLRTIRAIGYDMDYTLIHYRTEAWERRAYEHLRKRFADLGWPVEGLDFDPSFVIRGLVIDRELGNIVKPNRFGYVKRAFHGTRALDYDEQRKTYARTIVDLSEPRWVFLNTFFSLSEGCMYAQLVDRLDQRLLPEVLGYAELHDKVKQLLDRAHMEGELKAEITTDPDRFVDLDPETPLALLDQKRAGKKLLLISNSEWIYTRAIMTYAFDPFLPDGMTFRDLFDVLVVAARKPEFFTERAPLFEVVSEDGLLRPAFGLREGGAFLGGHAALVERYLGLSGEEILYVGDHIYGDVKVSKSVLRWRTALIVRELEGEIAAAEATLGTEERLAAMMRDKERLELAYARLRLEVLRARGAPEENGNGNGDDRSAKMAEVRAAIATLDAEIAPLAKAASELSNPRWGLLMRAGNDKSHLARQLERSADIYTSRVSNFLLHTPFAYLRPPRGSLPHDPVAAAPGSLPIESA